MTNVNNSIISKRNDSANIMLLCTIHDQVFRLIVTIRVSKYSKASFKIKQSVDDWRNSFQSQKYLYSPSFRVHKPFAEKII